MILGNRSINLGAHKWRRWKFQEKARRTLEARDEEKKGDGGKKGTKVEDNERQPLPSTKCGCPIGYRRNTPKRYLVPRRRS